MTPSDAPLTSGADPRTELAARELVTEIASTVEAAFQAPALLGGSAGRGEAVIRQLGSALVWESDLEAYVISDHLADRQRIREIGRSFSKHRVQLSLDWMTKRRWRTLSARNRLASQGRLTLQMYDLANCGRWINRDLPGATASMADIAADEGLRLILNRVVELSGSDVQADPAKRGRWWAKLALAAYDSQAITGRFYETLITSRLATMSRTSDVIRERLAVTQENFALLRQAGEHLLGGPRPDEEELRRMAIQLARSAIALEMYRLTGWFDPTADGFARLFAKKAAKNSLFFSYELAGFRGGQLENAIAIIRSGRRDWRGLSTTIRREPILFTIWSGAIAMLDRLDPGASIPQRTQAAAVISDLARQLPCRGDDLDEAVALWKQVV